MIKKCIELDETKIWFYKGIDKIVHYKNYKFRSKSIIKFGIHLNIVYL